VRLSTPSTRRDSIENRRIEAWSNTLADGLTQTWKKFFEAFVHAGIIDSELHYDIIALRFIYFKKVKEDIENFTISIRYAARRVDPRCSLGHLRRTSAGPGVRRYGHTAKSSRRTMSLAVFEASGFGWDDEKRLVTAEDSVWEELEKV
jgi:hypothetical protein